ALAVLLLPAAPAAADVDAAAAQLRSGPGVYVDPQAVGKPLSQDALSQVRNAVEHARTPIFIAALPDTTSAGVQLHLRTLIARVDVPATADEPTRTDYSGALDAYDRAKAALAAATEGGQLRGVTEALEEGRWRMECVRARLAGKPVPERLPPCFFDPRHGPS